MTEKLIPSKKSSSVKVEAGANEAFIDEESDESQPSLDELAMSVDNEMLAMENMSKYLIPAIDRLNFYGVSNDEIIEIFGHEENPSIIVAALYLDEVYLDGVPNAGGGGPDMYDCLLRAVGINAAIDIINGNLRGSALRRAIRKVATRTLGWVGAAWAIYEFGDCMGWYGTNSLDNDLDLLSRNSELYESSFNSLH